MGIINMSMMINAIKTAAINYNEIIVSVLIMRIVITISFPFVVKRTKNEISIEF